MSFIEPHHEFAKRKVQEGSCASASSVFAQCIERLMQEENEREAMSTGMADAIRARKQTPRSEFIEFHESDTVFEDVRRRLKRKG